MPAKPLLDAQISGLLFEPGGLLTMLNGPGCFYRVAYGRRPRLPVVAGLFLMLASSAHAATYYISPSGSDANDGSSCQAAEKTFSALFASKSAGDAFVLCSTTTDGSATRYTETVTGYINSSACANCAEPPNGTEGNFTTVSATTSVLVVGAGLGNTGGLQLGNSTTKKSYIKFELITFEGGGDLYNTSHIYLKSCGFHSATESAGAVFGIGTNDGTWGNTDNLVEDCWVWGSERVLSIVYLAGNNVFRRVFTRSDGCDSANCTGSGNPNVGAFTVYSSSRVSAQNVLSVDSILGGGESYANFATASHSPNDNTQGQNEWLGCLVLNAEDSAMNFEADTTNGVGTTVKVRDWVSWNTGGSGMNIGTVASVDVANVTCIRSGDQGIRLAPGVTGTINNVVVSTATSYGINSAVQPSYSLVHNAGTAYNQTTCATGCLTADPFGSSIKYPVRIETGSALDGTGSGGADYGANLIYQYGLTGTFAGETSSNTLTATALWPWPNEARIKSELCASRSSAFCSADSITDYVRNYAGYTYPTDGETPAAGTKFQTRGTIAIRAGVTFP